MSSTIEDPTIRRSTLSPGGIREYFDDAEGVMPIRRVKTERPHSGTLEAVIDDELVGVLFYIKAPHTNSQIKAKLERLFVSPDHRRRGIGRLLVSELAGEFSRIEAEVLAEKEAVQRFNESMGFVQDGSRSRSMLHSSGIVIEGTMLKYHFEGSADEILD